MFVPKYTSYCQSKCNFLWHKVNGDNSYQTPKEMEDVSLVGSISGMEICIQFSKVEWRLVIRRKTEVAQKIVLINEQPVYKVKRFLEKQEVSLPTRHKATMKKGMSLRARFVVSKRSLFHLLYGKVDDWMDPNMK